MKKFFKFSIIAMIITVFCFSYQTVNAVWVKEGNDWKYTQNGVYINDGYKKIDGIWYYFKGGVMQTGWVNYGGKWYYHTKSGSMKTGWLFDNSNWYYLNPNGSMRTGWLKWGGSWYFLKNSGEMQTSIIQIDGVNYDFNTSGAMKDTTPLGYPYFAYDRNGKEVEMIMPIKNGETVTVNLWEGMSLHMMAKRLNDRGVCRYEDFLKAVTQKRPDFKFESEELDFTFYRYEGYLFPDIYEFYLYEDPNVIVDKMMSNFEKRVDDKLIKEIEASGKTLHEVLTLASVVQGEASDLENMRKVAQVFINRLNNKALFPKLQANPTSNYANGVILATNPEATALAEEYDTYKSDGLMPGPINNPGLMAIRAVLDPDKTCEDYFFCTDKVTKEFYYAKTWQEHKKNTIKAGLATAE